MSEPVSIPRPRTEDPRTAPSLRWGVMGPGRIATRFVRSLQLHTEQRVTAVGSRDLARAQGFADALGIERALGGYEEVAASPDVDIVYIATPHVFHLEQALLALRAGKHVLIEKPIGVNAAEAEEIRRVAEEAGLFALEAMWPRFLPAADAIRQLIENGDLGEIRHLRADLGEYFEPSPTARLFDPALGGGSLLDLGVYLGAFASFVFGGAPQSLQVTGHRAFTGVSADAAVTLQYAAGNAQLFTSLEARTPSDAFIRGSRATLHVASPFYAPNALTLTAADGSSSATAEFSVRDQEDGLCYQAAEAARCIAAGLTASPLHPVAESVEILRTLDEIEERLPR